MFMAFRMSMGVYGFSGVCGFLCVFMNFWVFVGVYGCLWMFMDVYGFVWVSMGIYEFLGCM